MYSISWTSNHDSIPSENFLYRPGYNRSTRRSFLYLDPVVSEFKTDIETAIRSQVVLENLPPEDSVHGILSEYRIGIKPDSYWNRDITNIIKPIEDSMFNVFKSSGREFDDRHVVSNIATKIMSKEYFVSTRTIFLLDSDSMNFIMRVPFFRVILPGT